MEIIKLSDYTVSPMDSYVFDTNVWLYIYGPVAGVNRKKQSVYTQLLRDIIDCNATIFITSLIVSEYINSVLRMGFKQWMRETNNPKADYKIDYRATKDYDGVLQDAITQVDEIIQITERKPDDFNSIDVSCVLHNMNKVADYNDIYIAKNCEGRSKIKLVSDDADMRKLNMKVTLITA